MKKIVYIEIAALCIIVILVGINIFSHYNLDTLNLNNIDYRTDVNPLINRFGEDISIKACFWKAHSIGKTNFGPTSYWMKGFVILDKLCFKEIQNEYELTEIDLRFQNGLDASITGFDEFIWCYNEELSRKIAGSAYIGEFYIDIKNGVMFFDLESK